MDSAIKQEKCEFCGEYVPSYSTIYVAPEKALASFYSWIVKLAANTEAWSSTFSSIFNPLIHLIHSDDTSICCG